MAFSTVVKNLNDGSIVLKDATAVTPISVTVQYSQGDLSISGLRNVQKDVNAYQTRGVLNSVRRTTKNYPTFSFTAQMSQFTHATTEYLADAVMKKGAFLSGTSTLGTASDIWAITLVLTVEATDFDSVDHVATLTSCDCQIDFAEGDPNTFTVSGTCYGTITLSATM